MKESSEIVVKYKHNLIEYHAVSGNRGSSVSIVTSPRACPSEARSPATEVQAGSRAHRVSLYSGAEGCFPGLKQ
jgi:hypothetical protein